MTPTPRRPRVFRDPLHGDITFARGPFQRLLEAVIDTAMFQRLRGIRQTAVMNLVFQGAEHSRFAHSMGAAHVAGQMVDWAARNSGVDVSVGEREEVVLAALLHDIGHGPFSHSLEDIVGPPAGGASTLGQAAAGDAAAGTPSFHHERMSVRILTEVESEIAGLLAAHDPSLPSRLAGYIDHGPGGRPWLRAIVSSQLDADRLDYLGRDALMAGIRHQIDLWRLVRSLLVIDEQLVVDVRAQDVVEAFLLALDQMYGAAYYHKTVRAASLRLEAIIRRALRLAAASSAARAELFPTVNDLHDPFLRVLNEGDRIALGEYARLDEAHVAWLLCLWQRSTDPALAELVAGYRTRRFAKMVRLPIETTSFTPADWNAAVETAVDIFRRRFPGREPADFVHFDEPERVSYKRYAAGGAFEPIRVTAPGSKSRPIESDPRSIANNLSTRLYFPRLFVPDAIRDEVEAALMAGRR